MILNPIRRAYGPVVSYSLVKQTRGLRPTIKIGKETFQVSIDVRHFNKDEIKVKAHPDYVIIEGKQEKITEQRYVMRQFVRKFKLPEGCCCKNIESKISPDGILTVSVPRLVCDKNLPCESVTVPISYGTPENRKQADEENAKVVQKATEENKEKETKGKNTILGTKADICDIYQKVKPKPKEPNK